MKQLEITAMPRCCKIGRISTKFQILDFGAFIPTPFTDLWKIWPTRVNVWYALLHQTSLCCVHRVTAERRATSNLLQHPVPSSGAEPQSWMRVHTYKPVGLKTADHRRPPETTADHRRPHRRPPPDEPQTTTGQHRTHRRTHCRTRKIILFHFRRGSMLK